ncbi:X2-like carbohydrate binding domain-containing protein [Paenibacillus amylolyticus]
MNTAAGSYRDVETTISLNGNMLISIANGATLLSAGTDYTVSGPTVTIKKEYLATQPVGLTTLTLNFSAGTAQTLMLTVRDTTASTPIPSNPTPSPSPSTLPSTPQTVQVVERAASSGNFELVVPAMDFAVYASYGDKTVEISKFNAYVERTIAIPDGIDPNKITTGVFVEPDGTVRHVPTKVVRTDDTYFAKINSLTNSTYSIVWHPLVFNDAANHWAKEAVNDMGSRMVVNGFEEGTFKPNQNMTGARCCDIARPIRGCE